MDDLDWKTKGMNQLLEDVRQRQRNFVFPDTVRNQGEFYRNLASGNYERRSWLRPLVAVYGMLMLCEYLYLLPMGHATLPSLVETLALVAVGGFVSLKIIVNAALEKRPDPPPEFVRRRRKLMGLR